MKQVEISVIVPIYNAQNYMEKAIESLINQTFKNIEIILVNDGSTDKSKNICEKYSEKDKRIVVINKPNRGQADARNTGMKIAKGNYIMFLDADDLYKPNSCEIMYNAIEKSNADYAIGNYRMMDEDGTEWENVAFDVDKYQEFELKKDDYLKSFFVMNSTAWNKIYRTKFLKDNNIMFKIIAPSEDDYFTSLCYMKAKSGVYIPEVMYLYRNCSNSSSKQCSLEYFRGINYAYKEIYKNFKENNELDYYRYVYAKKNAYLLCQLIDSNKINDEEKIVCLKELEWYFELGDELKVNIISKSLREVMSYIKEKDYNNAIIEMNKLKVYRSGISERIKKRMSFPTKEDYKRMENDNKEIQLKEKECLN